MKFDKTDTVSVRRKKMEEYLHHSLYHIGSGTLNEQIASARHCEQMIGVTQVPLGVAGPVVMHRASGEKTECILPLATTEGALVASVNRGCKAIRESGGAWSYTDLVGATRGPVFVTKSIGEGMKLRSFIEKNRKKLQIVVATTSSHIQLQDIMYRIVGSQCFVRFSFDTKDAMGLNMITIASDAITRFIEQQTGVVCTALSGNFCVDKKPAWMNVILGRGMQVYAEVALPATVITTTLKTTAHAIYDVWLAKCMVGSAASGAMGYNAQFANVLAALFLATGQDIAHVGECSVGITTAEIRGNDLYMSVNLPDVMVGTIGGGTELETQKEALAILGIAGGTNGENKTRFGEIVGAAVLAGEISLLASLAQQSLAAAHLRLARGK